MILSSLTPSFSFAAIDTVTLNIKITTKEKTINFLY
jgi:hypothetical protein